MRLGIAALACGISVILGGLATEAFASLDECFREIDFYYKDGVVLQWSDLGCPANAEVCGEAGLCEERCYIGLPPEYTCVCADGEDDVEKQCNPHIQGQTVWCQSNGCPNPCAGTQPPPSGEGWQAFYCVCP